MQGGGRGGKILKPAQSAKDGQTDNEAEECGAVGGATGIEGEEDREPTILDLSFLLNYMSLKHFCQI